MSQTAALYHLQTLDSQRDQVRARLAEVARQLSQNEAVRSSQAALDAAQEKYRQWQTRATDLELKRNQLRDEAKAAEDRLYSGKVVNPRELTDLQEKISELSHRRDALEDPLLEAMIEIDESQVTLKAAEARLEQILAEQAQALGTLSSERDSLVARLQRLEGDIAQARAAVEARHLALYDDLRRRPGGMAVTEVHGSECAVCGVEITSRLQQQINRGEVLPCPTCGRILVIR